MSASPGAEPCTLRAVIEGSPRCRNGACFYQVTRQQAAEPAEVSVGQGLLEVRPLEAVSRAIARP